MPNIRPSPRAACRASTTRRGGTVRAEGTPPEVVAKLRDATAKAMATPGLADRLAKSGLEIWDTPADVLTKVIREDWARWRRSSRPPASPRTERRACACAIGGPGGSSTTSPKRATRTAFSSHCGRSARRDRRRARHHGARAERRHRRLRPGRAGHARVRRAGVHDAHGGILARSCRCRDPGLPLRSRAPRRCTRRCGSAG